MTVTQRLSPAGSNSQDTKNTSSVLALLPGYLLRGDLWFPLLHTHPLGGLVCSRPLS